MNSLLLVILSAVGYIIAYRLYGRYLGKKIFALSLKNKMPSHARRDNIDFVPTRKNIIFGHHFTTIAGLGPIVGPAIGVIWGWLPAFLWVFLGSIFLGAVHDFATLVISARHRGKTLGDLTGDLLGKDTRYALQVLMQLLLFVVLAVFAMIVGVLFTMYPEAVFPVWMQIPIAVWLGWQIRKGKNELLYSIIAVVLLYISVGAGLYLPITLPPLGGSSVVSWCLVLFVYVFFASTIPVHKLLQPRDYINSHQLLVAMLLLLIGLFVAHPVISAPAINPAALAEGSDIPAMMPILFITIACGAISGFHALASSGTTVKQLDNENDMLFVGYGSMLLESFLALVVLMAVAGGLGMGMEKDGQIFHGIEAFQQHYSSWAVASGLDAKLSAFVTGGANLMNSYGMPLVFAKALIAVFIVSFANTTLDSAARIQRLSLQEIFQKDSGSVRKPLNNRYVATLIVVILAAALTFAKPGAKGALVLWPLFGALNQLLAALALGIVTVFLHRKKKNIYISFLPMLFVLVATLWAMAQNLVRFMGQQDYLLLGFSVLILVLTVWLFSSGFKVIVRKRKK